MEPSRAPTPLLWEPSGRRLGEVWGTSGRRLGDGWEGFGRRLGDAREPSGKGLGHVWETFGRRLGPHRWPELEMTARPGEESSGGGGSGWGSRRCGSGQPAVPAGGISPLRASAGGRSASLLSPQGAYWYIYFSNRCIFQMERYLFFEILSQESLRRQRR